MLDCCINNIYSFNNINKANGLDLLADVKDSSIKTVFFDPQYRGVLDKLQYGNEGQSRGQGRHSLVQMDEITIKQFIKEINRVLCNSGYLFLWIDKFHLCQGIPNWLIKTELNIVDMIVWDKDKMGMGYRSRRQCEYLIVIQKSPTKAKGFWNDHSIPDVWKEKKPSGKDMHPHIKPIELQKRLISAVTKEGDIVLDPAAGGFSVLHCCKLCNRNFLGCDIRADFPIPLDYMR